MKSVDVIIQLWNLSLNALLASSMSCFRERVGELGEGTGIRAWAPDTAQWCLPNIDKVITFCACWLAHTNAICVRDSWGWKEKFVVACSRCRWNVKFAQKSLVQVLSCCFANLNLLTFWRFRFCCRSDILTSLLLSYGTVWCLNNWKCGFFLTVFPYFWRKGVIPKLTSLSRRSFFVSPRKIAGIHECSHYQVGSKMPWTLLTNGNIHDIAELRKKICQKVWKWNQGTKYFVALFLLLFYKL